MFKRQSGSSMNKKKANNNKLQDKKEKLKNYDLMKNRSPATAGIEVQLVSGDTLQKVQQETAECCVSASYVSIRA